MPINYNGMELRSEETKYTDNLTLLEREFYISYFNPLRESGIFVLL